MGSSRFNVRPKSSEETKKKFACPYCRDELAREAGALCATCLAVHHVECWRAHLRCASCGHSKGLLPPDAPKPAEPVPVVTVKVGVRARCDREEAALLLGARPAEVEWLIAKGHLQALQGDREAFHREDVLALRERLPELRDRMHPARRPGFLARLFGR